MTKAVEYVRSDNGKDREEWRLEQPQLCMYCGCSPDMFPLAVHEIERRSHAPKNWAHRCNYLLVCESCHAGEFATMPHAKQLAVKLIRDPKHFDLIEWLRRNDKELAAPKRVTLREIYRWAKQMDSSARSLRC